MTDNTRQKATKKPAVTTGRAIHRIDLTYSYEIFSAVPPPPPSVTNPRSKALPEKKKAPPSTARLRTPARLKHLTGPISVNVFVDVQDSLATLQEHLPRSHSSLRKSQVRRPSRAAKDDGERSQASSTERLLFESFGSFDEQHLPKRPSTHWQNVHHPQLTSMKVLHSRRASKYSQEMPSKRVDHASFENLSQESLSSTNERLYDRVEHLTRHYFPAIQQLRHTHPFPDGPTQHRMYLHREETVGYMPNLSRTRVQLSK